MAVEIDYRQLSEQLSNTVELFEERIAELEFAQEDVGWEQLNGSNAYEFSSAHLKKIVARSRLFFLTNPLIHRAVSLQSDYIFAQGLNFQATSTSVNKVVQKFMDDKSNIREIGHKGRLLKEQTLMLDGNVFIVLFTDVQTGRVQLRTILVDEIVDIITNPEDTNEVWFYKRQWVERDINGYSTTMKVALYPDIDYKPEATKKPKTISRMKVYWDAPVLHVDVGSLSKSRYGIPEVYSALDWAKAHQQFLQDWATIVRAYARFAFKFTAPDSKNSIAAAKTKMGTTVSSVGAGSGVDTNPASNVASIFARKKDGADIEPIKTAGATTDAADGREIRMMVAAALGIPDTFFGSVDVGNLATARTLDRPTELKFRSRQKLWEAVFTDILNYVIKWSIIAPGGELNKTAKFTVGSDGSLDFSGTDPETKKELDLHVEIVFPPILEHSILDRISAITEAFTLDGKSYSVDSPEFIKLEVRLMFQALGLEDVDELMDLVFKGIDLQKQIDMKNKVGVPAGGPNGGDKNVNNNPNSSTGNNKGNVKQPRNNPSTSSADNSSSNSQKA